MFLLRACPNRLAPSGLFRVPQVRKSIPVGKKRAQCAPNVPRTGNLPLSGKIFTKCTLSRAKGGKKTRSRTFHGEIFFKCARRSVHLANISPDRACFSVLALEIAHGVEILPGRTAHVARILPLGNGALAASCRQAVEFPSFLLPGRGSGWAMSCLRVQPGDDGGSGGKISALRMPEQGFRPYRARFPRHVCLFGRKWRDSASTCSEVAENARWGARGSEISPDRPRFSVRSPKITRGAKILPGRTVHAARISSGLAKRECN